MYPSPIRNVDLPSPSGPEAKKDLPGWALDSKIFPLDFFSTNRSQILRSTKQYVSELSQWRNRKIKTLRRLKAMLRRIMMFLHTYASYIDGKIFLENDIEEQLISLVSLYMNFELRILSMMKKPAVKEPTIPFGADTVAVKPPQFGFGASSSAKDDVGVEDPAAIERYEEMLINRFSHWIYTLLQSHEQRLDTLLSITVHNRHTKAVLDPIFRKVLSEMPTNPICNVSYVRHMLVLKTWRERALETEDDASIALFSYVKEHLKTTSFKLFPKPLQKCLGKGNSVEEHARPYNINLSEATSQFLTFCRELPVTDEEIHVGGFSEGIPLLDDDVLYDEADEVSQIMDLISERKMRRRSEEEELMRTIDVIDLTTCEVIDLTDEPEVSPPVEQQPLYLFRNTPISLPSKNDNFYSLPLNNENRNVFSTTSSQASSSSTMRLFTDFNITENVRFNTTSVAPGVLEGCIAQNQPLELNPAPPPSPAPPTPSRVPNTLQNVADVGALEQHLDVTQPENGESSKSNETTTTSTESTSCVECQKLQSLNSVEHKTKDTPHRTHCPYHVVTTKFPTEPPVVTESTNDELSVRSSETCNTIENDQLKPVEICDLNSRTCDKRDSEIIDTSARNLNNDTPDAESVRDKNSNELINSDEFSDNTLSVTPLAIDTTTNKLEQQSNVEVNIEYSPQTLDKRKSLEEEIVESLEKEIQNAENPETIELPKIVEDIPQTQEEQISEDVNKADDLIVEDLNNFLNTDSQESTTNNIQQEEITETTTIEINISTTIEQPETPTELTSNLETNKLTEIEELTTTSKQETEEIKTISVETPNNVLKTETTTRKSRRTQTSLLLQVDSVNRKRRSDETKVKEEKLTLKRRRVLRKNSVSVEEPSVASPSNEENKAEIINTLDVVEEKSTNKENVQKEINKMEDLKKIGVTQRKPRKKTESTQVQDEKTDKQKKGRRKESTEETPIQDPQQQNTTESTTLSIGQRKTRRKSNSESNDQPETPKIDTTNITFRRVRRKQTEITFPTDETNKIPDVTSKEETKVDNFTKRRKNRLSKSKDKEIIDQKLEVPATETFPEVTQNIDAEIAKIDKETLDIKNKYLKDIDSNTTEITTSCDKPVEDESKSDNAKEENPEIDDFDKMIESSLLEKLSSSNKSISEILPCTSTSFSLGKSKDETPKRRRKQNLKESLRDDKNISKKPTAIIDKQLLILCHNLSEDEIEHMRSSKISNDISENAPEDDDTRETNITLVSDFETSAFKVPKSAEIPESNNPIELVTESSKFETFVAKIDQTSSPKNVETKEKTTKSRRIKNKTYKLKFFSDLKLKTLSDSDLSSQENKSKKITSDSDDDTPLSVRVSTKTIEYSPKKLKNKTKEINFLGAGPNGLHNKPSEKLKTNRKTDERPSLSFEEELEQFRFQSKRKDDTKVRVYKRINKRNINKITSDDSCSDESGQKTDDDTSLSDDDKIPAYKSKLSKFARFNPSAVQDDTREISDYDDDMSANKIKLVMIPPPTKKSNLKPPATDAELRLTYSAKSDRKPKKAKSVRFNPDTSISEINIFSPHRKENVKSEISEITEQPIVKTTKGRSKKQKGKQNFTKKINTNISFNNKADNFGFVPRTVLDDHIKNTSISEHISSEIKEAIAKIEKQTLPKPIENITPSFCALPKKVYSRKAKTKLFEMQKTAQESTSSNLNNTVNENITKIPYEDVVKFVEMNQQSTEITSNDFSGSEPSVIIEVETITEVVNVDSDVLEENMEETSNFEDEKSSEVIPNETEVTTTPPEKFPEVYHEQIEVFSEDLQEEVCPVVHEEVEVCEAPESINVEGETLNESTYTPVEVCSEVFPIQHQEIEVCNVEEVSNTVEVNNEICPEQHGVSPIEEATSNEVSNIEVEQVTDIEYTSVEVTPEANNVNNLMEVPNELQMHASNLEKLDETEYRPLEVCPEVPSQEKVENCPVQDYVGQLTSRIIPENQFTEPESSPKNYKIIEHMAVIEEITIDFETVKDLPSPDPYVTENIEEITTVIVDIIGMEEIKISDHKCYDNSTVVSTVKLLRTEEIDLNSQPSEEATDDIETENNCVEVIRTEEIKLNQENTKTICDKSTQKEIWDVIATEEINLNSENVQESSSIVDVIATEEIQEKPEILDVIATEEIPLNSKTTKKRKKPIVKPRKPKKRGKGKSPKKLSVVASKNVNFSNKKKAKLRKATSKHVENPVIEETANFNIEFGKIDENITVVPCNNPKIDNNLDDFDDQNDTSNSALVINTIPSENDITNMSEAMKVIKNEVKSNKPEEKPERILEESSAEQTDETIEESNVENLEIDETFQCSATESVTEEYLFEPNISDRIEYRTPIQMNPNLLMEATTEDLIIDPPLQYQVLECFVPDEWPLNAQLFLQTVLYANTIEENYLGMLADIAIKKSKTENNNLIQMQSTSVNLNQNLDNPLDLSVNYDNLEASQPQSHPPVEKTKGKLLEDTIQAITNRVYGKNGALRMNGKNGEHVHNMLNDMEKFLGMKKECENAENFPRIVKIKDGYEKATTDEPTTSVNTPNIIPETSKIEDMSICQMVIPNTADLHLSADDDDYFPINNSIQNSLVPSVSNPQVRTPDTPEIDMFPADFFSRKSPTKVDFSKIDTLIGDKDETVVTTPEIIQEPVKEIVEPVKKTKTTMKSSTYLLNKYKNDLNKQQETNNQSNNIEKSTYIRSTKPMRMVTTRKRNMNKNENKLEEYTNKKAAIDKAFDKLVEEHQKELAKSKPVETNARITRGKAKLMEPSLNFETQLDFDAKTKKPKNKPQNDQKLKPTNENENKETLISKTKKDSKPKCNSPVEIIEEDKESVNLKTKKGKTKSNNDITEPEVSETVLNFENKIEEPNTNLDNQGEVTNEIIVEEKPENVLNQPENFDNSEKQPENLEETSKTENIDTICDVPLQNELKIQENEIPIIDKVKTNVLEEKLINFVNKTNPETTENKNIPIPVLEFSEQPKHHEIIRHEFLDKQNSMESVDLASLQGNISTQNTEILSIKEKDTENTEVQPVNSKPNAIEVVQDWFNNRVDQRNDSEPETEVGTYETIEECNFFDELSNNSMSSPNNTDEQDPTKKAEKEKAFEHYQTPDSGISMTNDDDSAQKHQTPDHEKVFDNNFDIDNIHHDIQISECTAHEKETSFIVSIPLPKIQECLPFIKEKLISKVNKEKVKLQRSNSTTSEDTEETTDIEAYNKTVTSPVPQSSEDTEEATTTSDSDNIQIKQLEETEEKQNVETEIIENPIEETPVITDIENDPNKEETIIEEIVTEVPAIIADCNEQEISTTTEVSDFENYQNNRLVSTKREISETEIVSDAETVQVKRRKLINREQSPTVDELADTEETSVLSDTDSYQNKQQINSPVVEDKDQSDSESYENTCQKIGDEDTDSDNYRRKSIKRSSPSVDEDTEAVISDSETYKNKRRKSNIEKDDEVIASPVSTQSDQIVSDSQTTKFRSKGSVKEYPEFLNIPSCSFSSPYPSDISLLEEPTFYVEGIDLCNDIPYYESIDSFKEQESLQAKYGDGPSKVEGIDLCNDIPGYERDEPQKVEVQQGLQPDYYCGINNQYSVLPEFMNDEDFITMMIDNKNVKMVAVNMHQVQPEMKPHKNDDKSHIDEELADGKSFSGEYVKPNEFNDDDETQNVISGIVDGICNDPNLFSEQSGNEIQLSIYKTDQNTSEVQVLITDVIDNCLYEEDVALQTEVVTTIPEDTTIEQDPVIKIQDSQVKHETSIFKSATPKMGSESNQSNNITVVPVADSCPPVSVEPVSSTHVTVEKRKINEETPKIKLIPNDFTRTSPTKPVETNSVKKPTPKIQTQNFHSKINFSKSPRTEPVKKPQTQFKIEQIPKLAYFPVKTTTKDETTKPQIRTYERNKVSNATSSSSTTLTASSSLHEHVYTSPYYKPNKIEAEARRKSDPKSMYCNNKPIETSRHQFEVRRKSETKHVYHVDLSKPFRYEYESKRKPENKYIYHRPVDPNKPIDMKQKLDNKPVYAKRNELDIRRQMDQKYFIPNKSVDSKQRIKFENKPSSSAKSSSEKRHKYFTDILEPSSSKYRPVSFSERRSEDYPSYSRFFSPQQSSNTRRSSTDNQKLCFNDPGYSSSEDIKKGDTKKPNEPELSQEAKLKEEKNKKWLENLKNLLDQFESKPKKFTN